MKLTPPNQSVIDVNADDQIQVNSGPSDKQFSKGSTAGASVGFQARPDSETLRVGLSSLYVAPVPQVITEALQLWEVNLSCILKSPGQVFVFHYFFSMQNFHSLEILKKWVWHPASRVFKSSLREF